MRANKKVIGVLALALMALQGCAGPAVQPDGRPGGTGPGAEGQTGPGAQAGGADMGNGVAVNPLEDPQSPLSNRVFYFPFDSSEVSAQDRETLSAHARFMAENPEVSVVIEGHADERGSREYNLALGERRAKSVERLLTLQGATAEQTQVISFGEERPVALGHDESAWGLNRRVEILYSGY